MIPNTNFTIPPISLERPTNASFPSKLWNGCKISFIFLCETTLKVSLFIALGITFNFIFPSLTPACYALAASSFLTRTFIKLVDYCNESLFDNLKKKFLRCNANYPKLRVICILFSLICSFLSPIIGIISGIIVGTFNGILMGFDQNSPLFQGNQPPLDANEEINRLI